MNRTITTKPKPGVQEVGGPALIIIARNGEKLTVLTHCSDLPSAKAEALSRAEDHDEIIIIFGTIEYRIWDEEAKDPADQ